MAKQLVIQEPDVIAGQISEQESLLKRLKRMLKISIEHYGVLPTTGLTDEPKPDE